MTPEESFLRSILDSPDDDDIVLIFADWLEDEDDPRANLLRNHQGLEERFEFCGDREISIRRNRELVISRETNRPLALIRSQHNNQEQLFRASCAIWEEAGVFARCSHPCLLPLEHLGFDRGSCFYAQRWVEAHSLDAVVSQLVEAEELENQLPLDQRARLFLKVANAIQHVHSQGLIHGNFGPHAVMLEPDLESLLVVDWSHAILEGKNYSQVREQALFGGNINCLPPEQIVATDPPTSYVGRDIYGLGVTLYLMLTGRFPYQGDNLLNIIFSMRYGDPPRPTELVSTVPIELEAICLKCMHTDPEQRYPSVQSLIEDLHLYLAGEWEMPLEPNAITKILRWCRSFLPGARNS
mgnify:CR=1 FL=1